MGRNRPDVMCPEGYYLLTSLHTGFVAIRTIYSDEVGTCIPHDDGGYMYHSFIGGGVTRHDSDLQTLVTWACTLHRLNIREK